MDYLEHLITEHTLKTKYKKLMENNRPPSLTSISCLPPISNLPIMPNFRGSIPL